MSLLFNALFPVSLKPCMKPFLEVGIGVSGASSNEYYLLLLQGGKPLFFFSFFEREFSLVCLSPLPPVSPPSNKGGANSFIGCLELFDSHLIFLLRRWDYCFFYLPEAFFLAFSLPPMRT